MSDLLRDCIADARAVRQTALANAKVALEEAFNERYTQVFAEKLREDAEQEETMKPATEETGMADETVNEQEIDELIKELEAEVGGGEEETPAAPAPEAAPEEPIAGAPAPAPVPGAVPPGCPPVAPAAPAVPGAPVPPVAPAVPGAPVPPPVGAAPMGAEPVSGEMPPAPAPETQPSDVPPQEETDEDINLDELLQSLKEEVEENKDEEDESTQLDEETKLTSSGIGGGKAGGSANKEPAMAARSSSKIESGGLEDEGFPSDDTKVGPEDATKAPRPNKGKNATSTNLSTPKMGGESGDAMKAPRPNKGEHATSTNLSTPGGMLKEENEELKKQLNEAHEAIKYVKGQLNEINLLNAKLLYTNKLFKEFSMANDQKMRVVEMFDLAKNVREVKLTYANIAESLNFGGNDKRKARPSANVTSITEGLASQSVGSTRPKQIIAESQANAMVTRFQKIAGIKPTSK